MEGSTLSSHQRPNEQEFNLKEWHLRARISRENTNSRRYSASYIRSFREDSRSFRSNFTVSSTASSPGYHLKDEIDPSTYSFTTALKALQARSGYVWEWVSSGEGQAKGLALNSKWDEAERYICNPLSGEVPMECLSAKTLSGRSFRSSSMATSRVTMSAPLIYSAKQPIRRPTTTHTNNLASLTPVIPQHVVYSNQEEKQLVRSRTRDVGTQSTPPEESSSSTSCSVSTPSIKERPLKRCSEAEDHGDTQNSSCSIKLKPAQECIMQVEVKITRERETTKSTPKEAGKKHMKKTGQLCSCRQSTGCLLISWRSLCIKRRQREKHKPSFANSQ